MHLWNGFRVGSTSGTDRKTIQLTQGNATCYPLYYFIPTFSGEAQSLIYHRAQDGDVQIYSLNIATGESSQLTHANSSQSEWIPWCMNPGTGVLDHRSALNTTNNSLIYFDSNDARCAEIESDNDRLLFSLSDDRIAIGQNCVTPNGEWFVYIHHDRELFEKIYANGENWKRSLSKGTALAAYNLHTGEHRDIVVINSPIHHVLSYGDDYLLFCHPALENGMMMTDINGGWYSHLRTMDAQSGCICHFVATQKGIAYEVLGRKDGRVLAGLYNPISHNKYEFELPTDFGYTHTGKDPEGRLWFFENRTKDTHDLHFLARHHQGAADEWVRLTANWPTYGVGQKSHFHPQITPDRKWILMTGGDNTTKSNHIFLLDISDLKDTEGIPDV